MIPEPVEIDLAATSFPDFDGAGAVVLVIAPDGRWLMQRRTAGYRRPGMVNGWGGGHEGNETLVENALRELQEETHAIAAPDELVFIGATRRRQQNQTVNLLLACFLWHDAKGQVAEAFEGELAPFANTESVLACPDLSFTTRWAIEEALRQGLLKAN